MSDLQKQIYFEYPKSMPWLEPLIQEEVRRTMERAAEGFKGAIAREFVLADAIATKKTLDSYQASEVTFAGDIASLTIEPSGDRYRAAFFLEYGREPGGIPPESVVLEWMQARGIQGDSPDKTRGIARALALTIATYGVEGRHILEKADRHYSRYIVQMFEASARRIADLINENLTGE